jgi:DNA-binding transcriptional LysR family regulator/ribosomal protein S18 acetylase RimI-like enzyme
VQWDDLRFALALQRSLTLSAAAKSLGVNHTTVARRIDSLEEDLGARLFDKTPGGFFPTRAGEDILGVAARIEDELLELDRQVLGRDTRLSGSLRVTTIDVFVQHQSYIFESFCKRYPEITLETVVSNAPQSLTKREADIAIRFTNNPPENLVGKRLGRLEFALYAARELVAKQSAPEEIEAYPWIAWDEKLNARMTEEWMRRQVPRAHVVARVDSSVTNIAFLGAGIGAAFAPCLWGDADPRLQRLLPPEPDFGMDLWLLTHPDLRHTARVRAFLDHAEAEMAPLKDRMAGVTPGAAAEEGGRSKETLTTKRLLLRPLAFSDAERLLPALSDEANMRYWSRGPLDSVQEVRDYIRWNIEGAGVQCFAICLASQPKEAHGWIVLIDRNPAEAEIGFIMRPDSQRQGLASEAARCVMSYAFGDRGLHRVSADVDPENQASIALLESLGMQREGHLRENWTTHLGKRDSYIYGRLASD